MALTYRIWDKSSPINDCPADVALQSLAIETNDQVYIIVNEEDFDWIVQTQRNAPVPGATIEESAQNHINKIIADQQAADKAAQKPSPEKQIRADVDYLSLMMGVDM